MFTVRLVEGPNLRGGRVELLNRGVWQGVCYDYIRETKAVDDRAAGVVCSMLGYGYAYYAFHCFGVVIVTLILLLIYHASTSSWDIVRWCSTHATRSVAK